MNINNENIGIIPPNLIDHSNVLKNNPIGSNIPLFTYFSVNDGSNIIKSWGIYSRKDSISAFCEILSLIFRIAGNNIEISPAHLESDAYDIVLQEFQGSMNQNTFKPPYLTLIKDKNKKLYSFWEELSKQIISSGSIFSPSFNNFMQWIQTLNLCKIRLLRQSSIFCSLNIFYILCQSLNRLSLDIKNLSDNNSSESIQNQLNIFRNEEQNYLKISQNICRSIIFKNIRDTEPKIRQLVIHYLSKGIISYPSVFCEDTYLTYIGWGLHDPNPKPKSSSLKNLIEIYKLNSNNQFLISFIQRHKSYIISLCQDIENSIVENSLNLLLLLIPFFKFQETDFKFLHFLLIDANSNIRFLSTKLIFILNFSNFSDEKTSLKYLIEFLKKYEENEIPIAIFSLRSQLFYLKNWQFLCDFLLDLVNDEEILIMSKILLYSAESAVGKVLEEKDDEDSIRNLTLILLQTLPRLLAAFQTDSKTQLILIQISRVLNLEVISEYSSDQLFPKLLIEIRNCFLNSTNEEVFQAASSVLYELSNGHHQLNEIAKIEINRLAVECNQIVEDSKISVGKFLSATRFVDLSDNFEAREMLFRASLNDDPSLVSNSIQCLSLFFQWDILKIKGKNHLIVEYYSKFQRFLDLFSSSLIHSSDLVRISAMKAFSSLLCLSTYLKEEDINPLISSEMINNYFISFHRSKEKQDLFEEISRPIIWKRINIEFSTHLLIYYSFENLKLLVTRFWSEIKSNHLIKGDIILLSLSETIHSFSEDQLMTSAKYLSTKFNRFDVIKNASNIENIESYISFLIPFLKFILPNEAEELIKNTNPLFHPILNKIISKEKITKSIIKNIFNSKQINANDDEPEESFLNL